MNWNKDDWDKPRTNGDKLTQAEIEFIWKSRREGKKIVDIARELKCASRTVKKYSGAMRPLRQSRAPAKPNLYHSMFEPS